MGDLECVVCFWMFSARNEMAINISLLRKHCRGLQSPLCDLAKGAFVLFYGAVCFFSAFLGFWNLSIGHLVNDIPL